MSLPSGNFILTNDGDGRVGIQSPVPPVQPIVRVNHNDIWTIKHIGGDQYLLKVSGYVVVIQGNRLVGTRLPGAPGIKWIIKQYEPGHYTIIVDPKSREGWTLLPGPSTPEVLLRPVPQHNVKPSQLWVFHPVLPLEEEEGN
ncbi:hypothetical protein BC827DRAFT_1158035 [Russula dissimulans]|nr:hypothetical protein BC827DRAFT_1158035 [Russula dissimulans]